MKKIFFSMRDIKKGRLYYDYSHVNLEGEGYNPLRHRLCAEYFAS